MAWPWLWQEALLRIPKTPKPRKSLLSECLFLLFLRIQIKSSGSHAEDARLGVLNRCIERDSDTEAEHTTQIFRLNNTVIPKTRRRVVCATLMIVVSNDGVLEFLDLLRVTLVLKLYEAEDLAGLCASHD